MESAVNGEGLLIAVPTVIKEGDKVIHAGWRIKKHNPLKKSDFASLAVYLRFQAYSSRLRAAIFVKNAEDKEQKANTIEKFGDVTMQKKAAKIASLRKSLETLTKQLEDEGIDVDTI